MNERTHLPSENVWVLTEAKINDLQAASIQRLIDRCGAAHHADLIIRINGQDEHYEVDWLKHLRPVVELDDQARLMAFYDATTRDEVIARMHHHIEKLQAKLSETPDMRPERVREG